MFSARSLDCSSPKSAMNLKGVPEPVTLFRLIRASGGGSRAGQRHLTALVGRDEEIAMLMRRWERARHGDGQLMLIVSEAGLGKSRLIEEFHARLSEVTHTWVEWGCGQLLQNTPLHPIAEWGRIRFGGTDVPADQRLADLESALAQIKRLPKSTPTRRPARSGAASIRGRRARARSDDRKGCRLARVRRPRPATRADNGAVRQDERGR